MNFSNLKIKFISLSRIGKTIIPKLVMAQQIKALAIEP